MLLLAIALPSVALAAADRRASPPDNRPAAVQASASVGAAPKAAAPAAAVSLAPWVADTDPSACRLGCADTYYACNAQDADAGCSGAWSQCVASCDMPRLNPGFSTSP